MSHPRRIVQIASAGAATEVVLWALADDGTVWLSRTEGWRLVASLPPSKDAEVPAAPTEDK